MNPNPSKGIGCEGFFPTKQWKYSDELQSENMESLFGRSDYAHFELIQLWVIYLKKILKPDVCQRESDDIKFNLSIS